MKKILILLSLILIALSLTAFPDIRIEAETGLAIPGYNDVRIPNTDNNTKFSLKQETGLGVALHTRLSVHYYLKPQHQLSLMATPLTLKGTEKISRNITYIDLTYFTGEKVEATYRFDSYRLQYRYLFNKELLGLIRAAGVSLKVRDAEIKLVSVGLEETKTRSKKNTGLVPLLSLNAGYRINPELDLILEAEGLASPYGRAEDVFAGAVYELMDKLSVKAGYRFLEGGSDVDEVYTFSAVHYAVLGFIVKL